MKQMIKTYRTFTFENEPDWNKVACGQVDFYQWETEKQYRPKCSFQLCFVKEKGIFLKMRTDETNIRAVCKGRDENCWEDSCMEFFFKPFSHRDEYLNFEMTAGGAYLCAAGKSRDNRIFLKELTKKEPTVLAEINHGGWSVELFVPCKLIDEVFGEHFSASAGNYRGNFFKCGDKTESPHFGSFSPMGELPPGFHNPGLFAKIVVTQRKDG